MLYSLELITTLGSRVTISERVYKNDSDGEDASPMIQDVDGSERSAHDDPDSQGHSARHRRHSTNRDKAAEGVRKGKGKAHAQGDHNIDLMT